MEEKISIQKENVMNAYKQASEEQKAVLENMFGKDMFKPKDIMERVKTFEDAVAILGNDNQAVIDYYAIADKTCTEDILAFAKLRVIAEALNEGWKPKFYKKESRYYPWFFIYNNKEYEKLNEEEKKECYVVRRSCAGSVTNDGVVYAHSYYVSSDTNSSGDSRLSLKTAKLAKYCGRQFIDIWSDYLFA